MPHRVVWTRTRFAAARCQPEGLVGRNRRVHVDVDANGAVHAGGICVTGVSGTLTEVAPGDPAEADPATSLITAEDRDCQW